MPRTNSPLVALLLLLAAAFGPAAASALGLQQGVPVGFAETFALAEDRGAVLDQLVPGTEEHFYYSCLHHQQRAELDRVDGLLREWRRQGRSQAWRQIEARQALLRASTDPEATWRYLEKELGLDFDHRRVVSGVVPDLPTQFDNALIDRDRLVRKILRSDQKERVRRFSGPVLESLVRMDLSKEQRAELLDQLERPDVPGLVEAVVADLEAYPKSAFGSRRVHGRLLLDQLEALRARVPALVSNQAYVEAVLRRLAPPADEPLDDPEARAAYLDRALGFVALLPDAFNSLEAHLFYHRLVVDLDLGRPDRARFLRYLRLPRHVGYMPLTDNQRRVAANLGEAFDGTTPLPAVRDDQALVTELLGELLRDADTYEPFLSVLPEEFVRRVWAETKLLHGREGGGLDALIRMLGGPEAAEQLKSRVELDFARTNPTRFRADEAVSLAVDVKNVETLLVKVFEIDAVGYFDRYGDEVSASLDLDGLVANDEQTLDYGEPPMRRVRRTLDLPALSGPGTYVVELIGGGVSSRAVVRKGALHLLERTGAAGHVIQVLDEERALVPSAVLRYGGRDFTPDERGRILVPFTTQPGRKTVLLRANGVASVATFDHLGESYGLDIAVHVPSEALLAGETASVSVRPRLSLNGHRIALDLLESPALVITAVDLDGTSSTKVVDGMELKGAREWIEEIQVPERLASLSVELSGTVRSLSAGADVTLRSPTRTTEVNGAARTTDVAQSFLTHLPGGYAIDLRGRNGEPLADREVRVQVRTQFIDESVDQRLKTDAQGRVELGRLLHASSVRVSGPAGASGSWDLSEAGTHGLPSELRGLPGVPLRVPYAEQAGPVTREIASLVELRNGHPLRDRFDALAREDGYLTLRGLPAGEYSLVLDGPGESYRVRIVDGVVRFGHLVGERRALAASPPSPLTIRDVVTTDEGLEVRLGGASESTRLFVFTTRYMGRYDALERLALARLGEPGWSSLVSPRSSYESGRAISDEYRYILDRRRLEHYPGNMLARAGVLLNPWALRETNDRMAGAGDAGGAYTQGLGGRAGGRRYRAAGGRGSEGAAPTWPELDFLAEPAAVLAGLVPDAEGRVAIPAAALGSHPMIRLVAVDDEVAVARELTRAERPLELRDRRLLDELDPDVGMTQQRRIAYLKAGETLEILDAPNANARTFDTLSDVFRLYRTMSSSEELVKFEFLTRWPALSREQKLEKYSEHVCHELNVFLREKDPEFFAEVVAPYLANKGQRTFLDDWLLDADLSGYLEPWRFERLNAVERILLLRRVGGDPARVAEDLYGLVPRGTFSLERAFDVVLASGGLRAETATLAAALDEASKEVRRLEERKRSPSPPGGPSTPGPARSQEPSGSDDFFLGKSDSAVKDKARAPMEEAETAGEPVLMDRMAVLEGLTLSDEEMDLDAARRPAVRSFFRDLPPTMELAETHYWRVPLGRTGPELVTISPFWVDFAAADGPFVSSSFPLATRSHTEMLLALAFLDLPFEAAGHEIASEGRSVRMTAGSPLLLALEDIGPATPAEGGASVLVGQDFFRLDRRTEVVDGVERERFVSGEYLVGMPYGCRMVITNPSSAAVELQALVQIPEGAIPLGGTRVTRGRPLTIPAYGTQSLETLFYFPEAGTFRDFPVHAGQGETLLGAAKATTLEVVEQLSQEDTDTWEWVSQNAELEAVVAFLDEHNPRALDLSKVAWRMTERDGFDAVTAALAGRNVYSSVLWQYAVKHRDEQATRRFLEANDTLIARVEAPFRSPLLALDARQRGSYEHLAYEPLVNGRAHEFGGERRILNDQLATQYGRFLRKLTLQPELGADDRMELAYYLLLQDRIGEALAAFDTVHISQVETRIQYEYMAAYMDFYRGDTAHARLVAQRHVDHPVQRWRARFRGVIAQLDEIEGRGPAEGVDPEDRADAQGALAGSEPVLELEVEGGRVVLTHERVESVELRYHLMDIEFLFSTNPFVRGEGGAFGFIEPNESARVALAAGATTTAVEIPDAYRRSNLFVEARGAGLARETTWFAGSLAVQGLERYGQIRVVESDMSTPLPRAYVKVYARLADGRVRFHKDGYTDLRGRFDYVSVSGWDGAPVERYAVLVMHDEAGATITELAPPVR